MVVIKSIPQHLTAHIQLFYSICASRSNRLNDVHCRIPDGTLDVLFNLGDPILLSDDGIHFSQMPEVVVTGLYAKRKFIRHTGDTHLVGAVFQPGYAHEVVVETLTHFGECVSDASQLFGSDILVLHEQIRALPGERGRHALIESYLFNRLDKIKRTYYAPKVHAAVKRILEQNGNVDIRNIYNDGFIGERTFRRRFLECVGISPKKYATIIKVKAFVRQYEKSGAPFSDIVPALSYTDQSHFIKDFRKITGATPTAYFGKDNPIGMGLLHLI